MEKTIEIPFGAKDSELKGWEYTIPENMEAEIKDGKVIVKQKESEDEKIRKTLLRCCDDWEKGQFGCMAKEDVPAIRAYLEKLKEQKTAVEEVLIKAGLKPFKDGNQWCILVGDNIQEGVCGFGDTIEDALYEFLKEVCEQQKPAEWSEGEMKVLDSIIDDYKKANKSFCGYAGKIVLLNTIRDGKYNLSKQEWSEDVIRKAVKEVGLTQHQINWFENNVFPPKQEWSEADKLHLNNAILVAKKEWGVNSYTARWLESLRDNYKKCNRRWKPSEEQIDALERAIVKMHTVDDIGILAELRDNLKKL